MKIYKNGCEVHKKSLRAQMTVPGLLLIFLGLMVLSHLMPTITSTTTNTSNNLTTAGYADEGLLYRLIPLFLIVVFLSSIALYGAPSP